MNAERNWTQVRGLINSMIGTESALSEAPAYLIRVLAEESWRSFTAPAPVGLVEHASFAGFVAAPAPRGLGSTVRMVKKVIDGIDDEPVRAKAQDLLDQALQNPVGKYESDHGDVDIVHGSMITKPDGNSKAAALRRLRKDAPELHAEVLAGNLSAHAAMVKAGFRRKTRTIRLDDADSAAKTIRKHMPLEARQRLARLLLEE